MSDVTFGILVFAALWILFGALARPWNGRCAGCGTGEGPEPPGCPGCPRASGGLEAERGGTQP